jgi:hypothetical protein
MIDQPDRLEQRQARSGTEGRAFEPRIDRLKKGFFKSNCSADLLQCFVHRKRGAGAREIHSDRERGLRAFNFPQ